MLQQLNLWAEEERILAQKANELGDEREESLAKMRANLYATTLRNFLENDPDKLPPLAEEFARRAEEHRLAGDFDLADRCRIERACVERALALLKKEEKP